jgi:hypothetical protein
LEPVWGSGPGAPTCLVCRATNVNHLVSGPSTTDPRPCM